MLLLNFADAAGETLMAGQEAAREDKRQFTLLKPTPPGLLREMSTDRPDKTESPQTVDAGHFQIEMDLLSISYDRANVDRDHVYEENVSAAALNLKAGILNNVDFQLVLPLFNRTRVHDLDAGKVEKRSGFGDIVLRTKINLWGNDDGPTALAVMPALKVPTNQEHLGNESVEGGLIVPFGADLPLGWDLGAMVEADMRLDDSGGGYHPEFIGTLTFGHSIYSKLSGYVEFFSLVSTKSARQWVGTVDLGLTYSLTPNVQLDGGINIGVTRSADDLNPFIGFSIRF
jgi:hypothetical protein